MQPMLTTEQIAQYQNEGFLLVPGLISSDEAAEIRREAQAVMKRLARDHVVEGTWSSAATIDHDEPTALQHCHDAHYHSAVFSRLLVDPRLLDVACALMGTRDIQLHHNKLFVKPPGNGSPFPLHQDWPFFPHTDDSTTAVILHLDDATEEKGCLRLMSGSHLDGRQEHIGTTDFHLAPDIFPLDAATPVPARAGDALFFSCLTVHGSGINFSDQARTTWLLQMRAADDHPTLDRHRSPGQGMMLSGVNTGTLPPPSSLSPLSTIPTDTSSFERF